jgi:hypothetical protein
MLLPVYYRCAHGKWSIWRLVTGNYVFKFAQILADFFVA